MLEGQSFFQILGHGMGAVFLLLLMSLASVYIIVDRVIRLRKVGKINPGTGDPVLCDQLQSGAKKGDKSALERQLDTILEEIEKPFVYLATIGSTAPFIGLFGTVIGITKAFAKISESGTAGFSVVSGAIAEALVATAAGLAVAIPAMVAYNLLTNQIDSLRSRAERFISESSDKS